MTTNEEWAAHLEAVKEHLPKFKCGDLVDKVGGRYGGPGRVVSVSENLGSGYRLYGVAMKVEGGYGEFVHVFPATALRSR